MGAAKRNDVEVEAAAAREEEEAAAGGREKEEEEVVRPETRVLYRARGQVRECVQWDERGNRFLVSLFEGGVGAVPGGAPPDEVVEEQILVPHPPRPGLSNLGLRIDYPRNRVVCCASDKANYLLSTVVAYDYTTWDTLFVVELASGPETMSLADDLTIDPEGDIYATDAYIGLIWKVKSDGSEFHVFSDSPLYKLDPIDQDFAWVRLDGIVYHPDGFLLVTHLATHALLKVSMDGKDVKIIEGFKGIALSGDGIALVNTNTLAMTGMLVGTNLLETNDNWETATVTHQCPPPVGTLATSVSLKDNEVFVGFVHYPIYSDDENPHTWTPGNTYTRTIGQPIFKPITP